MKYLCTLILIALSFVMNGQSIIGEWETFDDVTKERKAIIEIYKTNNRYFAKIVESYTSEKDAVCDTCKGAKRRR